jgi:outer membrane immunogenic protein
MRSKIVSLLAAAFSLGVVQAASAADMPTKAPMAPLAVAYNWTGFYIGINGGGASGTGYWDYVPPAATNQNHSISGGLIGGTVGYNWQFPATNWVVGLEGDWDWANINGNTSCPNPAFSCQTKTSSLGTFRGRVGYAMNNVLFYGTGGLAWGRHQAQTVLPGGAVPPSGTSTNGTTTDVAGYTLGGGIEYGFLPHWSAKIEGLFVSFPSKSTAVDNGLPVSTYDRFGMVRGGVNYRF